MGKVDFCYFISDEGQLAYSKVPLQDRLKWLDEIVRFTLMVRAAPTITQATSSDNTPLDTEQNKENT